MNQSNFLAPAPPSLPKVSIKHLMLWMFCSALHLTVSTNFRTEVGLPERYLEVHRVLILFNGIVFGAAYAGAIVLFRVRWNSGFPIIHQPGHWLLLIVAGIGFVFSILFMSFYSLLSLMRANEVQLSLYGIVYGVQTAAFLAAMRRCQSARWKLWFGCAAVLALLLGIGYFGLWSELYVSSFSPWGWILIQWVNVADYLLSLVLVVFAVIEFSSGPRRDWLHWLGIFTYLVGQLGNIIWMVGNWLLERPEV